ncbi:MAG: type II toxin-antitoxin system PemK/MazF family toxin [Atopobiaceae bacterium]
MSDALPRIWEVWHARFDFEGGRGYKYRPVIVVGVRSNGSLMMMVTSATNKLHLEHDYLLRDWQQAGLDKPSIARVDRIAEIPPHYVGTAGRIGMLSEHDIAAIARLLNDIVNSESTDIQ